MSFSRSKKNVRLLGHSNLNGFGNGGQIIVQRRGREYYAFIGHMKDMGTSIVNVTNPKKPEVISQIPIFSSTHSHKVRVCGDIMLVNNERYGNKKGFKAGLRIFDVSNLSDPFELSFFKTGGRGVHRFWFDCITNQAFISTEMDGFMGSIFMIVDISNPKKPREVSRWWLTGQWVGGGEKPTWDQKKEGVRHHHPIVLGNRAYLGYWDAGFIILDIHDVHNPKFISRGDYSPPYGGAFHTALPINRKILGRKWLIVFQESTKPYFLEEKKVMWVVDITLETNPVPVSTFFVPEKDFGRIEARFGPHQPFEDVDATENLIYAAWFSAGIRIINIANPYKPEEVGYFIPPTPEGQESIQTNDVFVDDRGFIYIIDRLGRGLDILEYTGPKFI